MVGRQTVTAPVDLPGIEDVHVGSVLKPTTIPVTEDIQE